MKHYGYLRVSTEDQVHGQDAQQATIENVVRIDEWFKEEASGKDISGRPVFQDLVDRACQDKATIVVAKLDRLGRSVVDVLNVFAKVKECGAAIKVLDMGIDTSTPAGEMMLTVLAAFAQFERRMIGERTKAGLAAARAKGVRLGAPETYDHQRIRDLKAAGGSNDQIAATVGCHVRTVQRVLEGKG